ncbi:MAG: hypothetical protein FJW39_20945 [Acidobacteria bacterium]|nr:hypothetical protein [Acidobacteriota bacterium]
MTVLVPMRIYEAAIAARVADLELELAPDVVRIRFSVTRDYSGEPCIEFRVLVTDEASKEDRLREAGKRVRTAIYDGIDPLNTWGLFGYPDFRNESEQAEFKVRSGSEASMTVLVPIRIDESAIAARVAGFERKVRAECGPRTILRRGGLDRCPRAVFTVCSPPTMRAATPGLEMSPTALRAPSVRR